MATSLELASAERPDYVQFNSLLPLIETNQKSGYATVYGATCRASEERSLSATTTDPLLKPPKRCCST